PERRDAVAKAEARAGRLRGAAARDHALRATRGLGDGVPLGTPRLGNRLREERLPQSPQHLPALPFQNGHEPAELQPRQLERSRRAHRPEAEVGEEVAWKDGSVDEEALVVGLALGIAVRKRFERGRALVLSVANRGEEQRLQHPWA